MKITRIRKAHGKLGRKITMQELVRIVVDLELALFRAGFETIVRPDNLCRINIATADAKLFKVDVERHGWNAHVGIYNGAGCVFVRPRYERTRLPTWSQKFRFYQIINEVLDSHKVSALARVQKSVIRSAETGSAVDWSELFDTTRLENLIVSIDEADRFFAPDTLAEIKRRTLDTQTAHTPRGTAKLPGLIIAYTPKLEATTAREAS